MTNDWFRVPRNRLHLPCDMPVLTPKPGASWCVHRVEEHPLLLFSVTKLPLPMAVNRFGNTKQVIKDDPIACGQCGGGTKAVGAKQARRNI